MTDQVIITVRFRVQHIALLQLLQLMQEKHQPDADRQGDQGGIKGDAQDGMAQAI